MIRIVEDENETVRNVRAAPDAETLNDYLHEHVADASLAKDECVALADAILERSLRLRPRPLFAIRIFGGLAPPDRAPALLGFLDRTENPLVQRTALQAICAILEFNEAPDTEDFRAFRKRLEDLATESLNALRACSGQSADVALAVHAFCAAALADAPGTEDLCVRLASLLHPRMASHSLRILEPALVKRKQRRNAEKLEAAITHLRRTDDDSRKESS